MTAFTHLDEQKLRGLGPRTLIVGIMLVLIGAVGVLLPWTMSLVTSIYIAVLLLWRSFLSLPYLKIASW